MAVIISLSFFWQKLLILIMHHFFLPVWIWIQYKYIYFIVFSNHTLALNVFKKKVCCGVKTSMFLNSVLCPLDLGGKGTFRLLPVQSWSLWWYGGVLVPTAWVTCTYVKELLLLKGIYSFWSNICCPSGHIFLGTF